MKEISKAYALLAAAIALHLWINGLTGFGDSEAYYVSWSFSLQWSYFDHPPLLAWLLAIPRVFGGIHPWSIRLIPTLCFGLTAAILMTLAKNLGQNTLHFLIWFLAIPMIQIGSLLASPDLPLLVFWALGLLLSWHHFEKCLQGQKISWWDWTLLGTVLGLGFLSKYTALFFISSFIWAYVRLQIPRPWKKWGFWWAGLWALILASPVLFWNASHHWPTLSFHLWERHRGHVFQLQAMVALLGGQLLYLGPGIAWILFSIYVKNRKHSDWKIQWALAFTEGSLFPLLLISALTTEAEPHWPLIGYIPLLLIAPQISRHWSTLKQVMFWGVHFLIQVLFLIHTLTPWILDRLPQSYDPKWDITHELYGWDQALTLWNARLKARGISAYYASYHYTICAQLAAHLHSLKAIRCPSPKRDAFDDLLPPPQSDDVLVWIRDLRYTRSVTNFLKCRHIEPLGKPIHITRGSRIVRTFWADLCWVDHTF